MCFFFYLKVVPLGPSFCGWIKNRFFLTTRCLEQKREAPKASDVFGDPFYGYFPSFHQEGTFFSSKPFLIKISHFITKHLEPIWFSLMSTLWCLEQKRGPRKNRMPLGSLFKGIFPFQSVSPSVRQSVSPSVHQSISPSVHQLGSPSVRQSIRICNPSLNCSQVLDLFFYRLVVGDFHKVRTKSSGERLMVFDLLLLAKYDKGSFLGCCLKELLARWLAWNLVRIWPEYDFLSLLQRFKIIMRTDESVSRH